MASARWLLTVLACCCANNLQQTLTNELEFIARQFNSHQHLQFVNEAVCNTRRVKMVLQGGVMQLAGLGCRS
jgi:hypothetical protein